MTSTTKSRSKRLFINNWDVWLFELIQELLQIDQKTFTATGKLDPNGKRLPKKIDHSLGFTRRKNSPIISFLLYAHLRKMY